MRRIRSTHRRRQSHKYKRNSKRTRGRRGKTARTRRVNRKGGSSSKHIDNTFVNDALPYGEYRTRKGIVSGFQLRK